MPRYKVQAPDGRTVTLEGDTPPTEADLDQVFASIPSNGNQAQTQSKPTEPIQSNESLGIKDGQLTSQERLEGGFRSPEDLKARRDTQRQALGIEEGAPIEPTGMNMQNILDLPNDILDMVGPAFPALGQLFASLPTAAVTKNPQATLVASGVGSAAGEFVRQEVGKQLFGFEQGVPKNRATRVAIEGGIGLAGEAAAQGINVALSQTKRGILQAIDKVINRGGLDKGVEILGKIAPDLDPQKTQFALSSLRSGDQRVLQRSFADEEYALNFAQDVIHGGKNSSIIDHLTHLGRVSKSPESVASLMREFVGIPDEITTRIMSSGGNIPSAYRRPETLNKIAESSIMKLNRAKDIEIQRFGLALENAASKFGAKQVLLDDINESFMKNLNKVGVLDEFGNITPDFKKTEIGKVAEKFLSRFASKETPEEFITRAQKTGRVAQMFGGSPAFKAKKSMKYADLLKEWKEAKNSMTRDIFQNADQKVTFPFAQYFDEVGSRMAKVGRMEGANQRYATFMGLYRPLESQTSNKVTFNNLLKSLDDKNITQNGVKQLERLMPRNLNFSDDVLNFNAVQKLIELDKPVARKEAAQKLTRFMDNVFGNSAEAKANAQLVRDVIDPGLPKALRITDKAKIHSTAKALNKSALSLLRARFLASGIGLGALTPTLGPLGAAGTIGAGLILQDPRLFKTVLKVAANAPQTSASASASQAVRSSSPLVAQSISGFARADNQNREKRQ